MEFSLWGLGFVAGGLNTIYRDNGKQNGNYRDYRDDILGLYRDYMGLSIHMRIMENNMETTGIIGIIYWDYIGLYIQMRITLIRSV